MLFYLIMFLFVSDEAFCIFQTFYCELMFGGASSGNVIRPSLVIRSRGQLCLLPQYYSYDKADYYCGVPLIFHRAN